MLENEDEVVSEFLVGICDHGGYNLSCEAENNGVFRCRKNLNASSWSSLPDLSLWPGSSNDDNVPSCSWKLIEPDTVCETLNAPSFEKYTTSDQFLRSLKPQDVRQMNTPGANCGTLEKYIY